MNFSTANFLVTKNENKFLKKRTWKQTKNCRRTTSANSQFVELLSDENDERNKRRQKKKKNTLHQSLTCARNWNTTDENVGKGKFMLWVSK